MSETILVEIDGGVGIVTLNRPERHNAFDDVLIGELTVALREVDHDDDVRVVVLSSTGTSFCAGADLNWMKRAANYSQTENLRDAMNLANLLQALNELGKPTVARVQGPAYGGGVGLIAACDVAMATFDAHFALSEVKLGIIPAVISPYVIAAIGERKARRYMLSAERFSASEAYRLGLVHEIAHSAQQLDNAIGELVDALLSCGPKAQAECKHLIRSVASKPISETLIADTAARITRVRASEEGKEGMSAFLERRAPRWVASAVDE
jgi:methylglutaconyl-CoA hydratase